MGRCKMKGTRIVDFRGCLMGMASTSTTVQGNPAESWRECLTAGKDL